MNKINIQFSRFSAFYSPLILTISEKYLQSEGLSPYWSIANNPGEAIKALQLGKVHVIQSAISQSFSALEKNESIDVEHFAQINERDGFFITGRDQNSNFTWDKLEGTEVLLQPGGQPLCMFKYACHKAGINYKNIKPIIPENGKSMDQYFREGNGQYIHQQGPEPQQIEADGLGFVLTKVGETVGKCAFSSLASKKDWPTTDMGEAFCRAYKKACTFIKTQSPNRIARSIEPYFKNIGINSLEECIRSYQSLGCWTGSPSISRESFDKTLDIFDYNSSISRRYRYEEICTLFPGDK